MLIDGPGDSNRDKKGMSDVLGTSGGILEGKF